MVAVEVLDVIEGPDEAKSALRWSEGSLRRAGGLAVSRVDQAAGRCEQLVHSSGVRGQGGQRACRGCL